MAPRALRCAVCVGPAMAVIIMSALCSRASAQAAGCTPMVVNLSPCVAYITSNMSAPPATCCTQFGNVVQTQMACLCMLLANGSPFRIPVNQTQVLSLPGACNIKAGPLSQCNAVGIAPPASSPPAPVAPAPASPATTSPAPGVAPSASVSPSVPVTPSTPSSAANAPSGRGSKVVPGGPVGGSSTASMTHIPLFFCFLMAVSSFVPVVVGF